MKELNEVCNKFLDNADLIISKNNSVDIEFIFYVYWKVDDKYWKIIFNCNNIISSNIRWDNYLTNDLLLVLLVKVNMLNWIYNVYIEWDVELKIECKDFQWDMNTISKNEYDKK
jgi:hypothetical protein